MSLCVLFFILCLWYITSEKSQSWRIILLTTITTCSAIFFFLPDLLDCALHARSVSDISDHVHKPYTFVRDQVIAHGRGDNPTIMDYAKKLDEIRDRCRIYFDFMNKDRGSYFLYDDWASTPSVIRVDYTTLLIFDSPSFKELFTDSPMDQALYKFMYNEAIAVRDDVLYSRYLWRYYKYYDMYGKDLSLNFLSDGRFPIPFHFPYSSKK